LDLSPEQRASYVTRSTNESVELSPDLGFILYNDDEFPSLKRSKSIMIHKSNRIPRKKIVMMKKVSFISQRVTKK
jgi:hypothetical protein